MVIHTRTIELAIGWLFVAAIVVFSLTPDVPRMEGYTLNDKLAHFAAYGVVMAWFARLYPSLSARTGYAVFFILLGGALEFLQTLTPTRSFEVADLVADAVGVAVGLIAVRWLRFPARTQPGK